MPRPTLDVNDAVRLAGCQLVLDRDRTGRSPSRMTRKLQRTSAGMHDAVYLALCDRMRELLPPSVFLA